MSRESSTSSSSSSSSDQDSEPPPAVETKESILAERTIALKPLRKRYPAVLWEGTSYKPTRFSKGWKPSSELPARLNGEERAEWLASAASERHHLCCSSLQTYHILEALDASLSKGRQTNATRECKNLFSLGEWRAKKNRKVPKDGPSFKTPKRRNQDYKNKYEIERMAFKKRLEKILDMILEPKSGHPRNLPKKPKDDGHDDDDQPGKAQGLTQTTRPLQAIKT